jgi:hypothetical protein
MVKKLLLNRKILMSGTIKIKSQGENKTWGH